MSLVPAPCGSGRYDGHRYAIGAKRCDGFDRSRYKRRNRVEIMFGGLKHWRRDVSRYCNCRIVLVPAIAVIVLF
jgi:hypothetical protein